MQIDSIAEWQNALLQYFCPALSDNRFWKPIFGLFESGRFRKVFCTVSYIYKNEVLLCSKI